ncbi:SHOCT domain-containing protein [Neobacillus drentensis]|uniref:SHOCT domain-containing protein n=1 Tax=Neobacillus drentensis TaxID=220684 RepID=UPI00285B2326|nr:SHOCT domain-containing protein [Neobacillus drentensis]MDR7238159.1 general stress protein 26 [Neobacillus drentensis]
MGIFLTIVVVALLIFIYKGRVNKVKQNKEAKFEEEVQEYERFINEVGEKTEAIFGTSISKNSINELRKTGSFEIFHSSNSRLYINKKNNMVLVIDEMKKDYYCFSGQDIVNVELIENKESMHIDSTSPMSNRSAVSSISLPVDIKINITLNNERAFISFTAWDNKGLNYQLRSYPNNPFVKAILDEYPDQLNTALSAKAMLLNESGKQAIHSNNRPNSTLSDEISNLKKMKDEGILSEEEFNQAKSKILA